VRSTPGRISEISLADEAEVRLRGPRHGREPGVDTGEADRGHAVRAEERDEVRVDRPGEHHRRDVERLGVGDAHAAHEGRLESEPRRHLGHLRPAAVDEDRFHAGVLDQRDVVGERARQRRLGHHGATDLDHDDRVAVLAEERERLDERAALRDRPLADLGCERDAHVWYSALIFT
jgi:hypothetical protein